MPYTRTVQEYVTFVFLEWEGTEWYLRPGQTHVEARKKLLRRRAHFIKSPKKSIGETISFLKEKKIVRGKINRIDAMYQDGYYEPGGFSIRYIVHLDGGLHSVDEGQLLS